jgi:hypothetical protein
VVAAHTATYNFLTSLSQAGKFNWRDEPLFSFFFFSESEDRKIWKFDTSGTYSVSLFRLQIFR